MREIVKKRLIYYTPWTQDVIYGAEEYDASLPDEAILASVHEVGKTQWMYEHDPWHPKELWLLQPHLKNPKVLLPMYRIEVQEISIQTPTWIDRFKRRITK